MFAAGAAVPLALTLETLLTHLDDVFCSTTDTS